MFEGGNQNGGGQLLADDSTASQPETGFLNRLRFSPGARNLPTTLSQMLVRPQPSGTQNGDFVNRYPLRLPSSGIAYRSQAPQPASTPATVPGTAGGGASSTVRNPYDVANEKVQQYGTPVATRDAQGKTLPKYRMGIGHRILGTLANFANGFAGNRVPPIYVGRGAVNNRYYEDEHLRQQNLENALRERDALQGPAVRNQMPAGGLSLEEAAGQNNRKNQENQENNAAPKTDPSDKEPGLLELTLPIAQYFFGRSGGNANLARRMARRSGYKV